jgi:hypothetical protein
MRNKNLRNELIPAEKRLARIDAIDAELERRLAAKEIGLVEYVGIKQPLTVKRYKEFRLVEKAMGWDRFENLDTPEKVPIVEVEQALEPVDVEPVAIGQRVLGLVVFVVLVCSLSFVWCWFTQAN